jgi:hypothetical protein
MNSMMPYVSGKNMETNNLDFYSLNMSLFQKKDALDCGHFCSQQTKAIGHPDKKHIFSKSEFLTDYMRTTLIL